MEQGNRRDKSCLPKGQYPCPEHWGEVSGKDAGYAPCRRPDPDCICPACLYAAVFGPAEEKGGY